MEHNEKISLRQLQILLIFDIFGTGVIILPRKVAAMAAQDGWMLVVGAILLTLFFAYIISTLNRMFPDDTFVEYAAKIMTKPIGYTLGIILALKFMVTIGLELKVLGEIIRQFMLANTPTWVIIFVMILAAAHVAYNGYECRARLAEILIFIAFIPLALVFFMACFQSDFSNLRPVLTTDAKTLLKGSFFTAMSFTGLDFLLMSGPFLNNTKDARKRVSQVVILIGVMILAITIITLCRFGVEDTQVKLWPVLQMMDTIDLPGSFIERQDVLVMSFWIISVFAITNAGVYFASLIFSRIFASSHKQSHFVLPVLPVVFAVALIPENIALAYDYIEKVHLFGFLFTFIIPFILLIVARIRKLGDRV